MPPCAAIEWARRGLSWSQKASTWYPSSASEAAAEAPARPVPTTRTLYLRLLDGLTSFRVSKRCLSQVSSMRPVGALPSRITLFPLLGDEANENEHGDGPVADEEEGGEHLAAGAEGRQGLVVVEADALEGALHPVGQVEEERHHGGDVG